MSFILHFNICQTSDCKSFKFTETTGLYNVGSNPTGWESPNPAIASASSASLVITTPGGVSYTIDLLTEGFPSSDPLIEFAITADMIGGASGASIPDGIYTFVYTVVAVAGDTPTTYTQTVRQGFYCQVTCCVYSMFKDIDHECDCMHDAKLKALDAFMLLIGLRASANCGNTSNFNTDLAVLQKLCLNSGCTTCK